jgi:hypothetical protein
MAKNRQKNRFLPPLCSFFALLRIVPRRLDITVAREPVFTLCGLLGIKSKKKSPFRAHFYLITLLPDYLITFCFWVVL